MTNQEPVELKSQNEAVEFYEEFFEDKDDYLLCWWQPHQFDKLKDVLGTMGIAPGSRIFDFGCGVGDVASRPALTCRPPCGGTARAWPSPAASGTRSRRTRGPGRRSARRGRR